MKRIVLLLFLISPSIYAQTIFDSCFVSLSQIEIQNNYKNRMVKGKMVPFGFLRPPYTKKYYKGKDVRLVERYIIVDTASKTHSSKCFHGITHFFANVVEAFDTPIGFSCGKILSTNDAFRIGRHSTSKMFSFRLSKKLIEGEIVQIPIYYYSPDVDITVYANNSRNVFQTISSYIVFNLPKCSEEKWYCDTISFQVSSVTAGRDWLCFYGDEMAFLAPCCYPENIVFSVDTARTKEVSIDESITENHFDTIQVLTLSDILFETNSAEFEPDTTFYDFAEYLYSNPKITIKIIGYTDDVGDEKYNLKLSKQRAKAVYQEFIVQGIKEDRMQFSGKGEENPVADNSTEEGRSRNRRVEILIKRE